MNPEFINLIKAEKSPVFDGLFPALELSAPVSIRLNKGKTRDIADLATAGPLKLREVPWEPAGWFLSERPSFTLDPEFHQGRYYVQEASSMFVGEVLRRLTTLHPDMSFRLLDACAAPGGKTTALLDNMPAGSALIANEFDYRRAEILKENIAKWGNPSVAVTRGDTSQFSRLKNCFDIVLVDAPCSGEGMFRKDPGAREQWSRALVAQCAARQREIVENLLPAVAPGGYIIYSTCTFNTLENERNVEWFCRALELETVDLDIPEHWNIAPAVNSDIHAYRFMPQRIDGEGLFLAVMKKPGELRQRKAALPKKTKISGSSFTPENFTEEITPEGVNAISPALATLLTDVDTRVKSFIARGVTKGVMKGKDFIPSNALALSTVFPYDSYPARFEVTKDLAINYLRRESTALPDDMPNGYCCLTYGQRPLGWVKKINNRVNNLLPKEWRIRIQ